MFHIPLRELKNIYFFKQMKGFQWDACPIPTNVFQFTGNNFVKIYFKHS